MWAWTAAATTLPASCHSRHRCRGPAASTATPPRYPVADRAWLPRYPVQATLHPRPWPGQNLPSGQSAWLPQEPGSGITEPQARPSPGLDGQFWSLCRGHPQTPALVAGGTCPHGPITPALREAPLIVTEPDRAEPGT